MGNSSPRSVFLQPKNRGPATKNRLLSQKYLDDTTGWYYYGYRYYSPELGRWPSRDPIGEDGGVNLYSFTVNTPLLLFDMLGAAAVDFVTYNLSGVEVAIETVSSVDEMQVKPKALALDTYGETAIEYVTATDDDEGNVCHIKVRFAMYVSSRYRDRAPTLSEVWGCKKHWDGSTYTLAAVRSRFISGDIKAHERGHMKIYYEDREQLREKLETNVIGTDWLSDIVTKASVDAEIIAFKTDPPSSGLSVRQHQSGKDADEGTKTYMDSLSGWGVLPASMIPSAYDWAWRYYGTSP